MDPLESMRKTVFAAKPVFASVLVEHGEQSLFEYFSCLPAPVSVINERKIELLATFQKEISRILGKDVAIRATRDLEACWYVSTADHHGPLTHAFFGNSAIMHSYVAKTAGRSSVVVLPCGGVSINNSSFPRGFLLHDVAIREVRLHLVSRTKSGQPVYSRAPYGERECASLRAELECSTLSSEAKSIFLSKIFPIINCVEALALPSYSEQMTYLNYHLWKLVPGQEGTDLVYLEQESLVRALILNHHLGSDTPIALLLRDAAWQKSFEKHFEGIPGAFSGETKKGTFLFWGIENGLRVALRRGDVRIGSLAAIGQGLSDRTLMPSMALTLIIISFYYGITCGGGFSQVNYLADMQKAYARVLQECSPEFDTQTLFPRTNYFCSDFVLGVLEHEGKEVAATPIDYILYGIGDTAVTLLERSKKLSLKEAVDGLMPELHSIVTGVKVSKDEGTSYTGFRIYDQGIMPVLRK